jgi:hypothetical protein
MKYHVFYTDYGRGAEKTVEAADHRSAAKYFHTAYPRTGDCCIAVETVGWRNYSIQEFRTSVLKSTATAEPISTSPPDQPTTPMPILERGSATACIVLGILERGSATACIVLGIIFLLIGACFLIQPSTEMGRSLQSYDLPTVVNFHKLYIGQTCSIIGAIFLAVGIRPR